MASPSRPPSTFQAHGIELRALGADDWRLEQELSRDTEVTRWTFYSPDMTNDQARERIATGLERAESGFSQRYAVLVEGEPVGSAGLVLARTPPEIFYALLPAGRGRGVATAAATILSDWLLANHAETVALWTVEGNAASEAVAQRAAFELATVEVGEHQGREVNLHCWLRQSGRPADLGPALV
jgi:RimJ/RimL family protein N-acetyltransferase